MFLKINMAVMYRMTWSKSLKYKCGTLSWCNALSVMRTWFWDSSGSILKRSALGSLSQLLAQRHRPSYVRASVFQKK